MTDSVFGTPDAKGWYEWKGDDMVRPVGIVEVEMRDGFRCEGMADGGIWRWTGGPADIVKWRPAVSGCRRIGCSHEICGDKE